MSKLNVVLVGNYGAGNLGDDLLCLASVKGVRDLWQGCDLKVLAANPKRLINNAFKLEAQNVARLWPSGLRSLVKALWRLRIKKTWQFYGDADLIVFGGGGLLNAEVPKSLFVWGWQLFWARWFRKPVAMLGQSFPEVNLRRWRWLTKFLLSRVELITVRDPISYRVGRELAPNCLCKQTADLALTLDPNDYSYENYREPMLLVNWRYYKTIPAELLEQIAYRVCDYLLQNSDYELEFVCLDDQDRDFANTLHKMLKKQPRFRIGTWDNCSEVFDIFEQASGVLSMRLHGLITAYLTDTPLFGFVYNDKVKGWLKQIDLQRSAIELRSRQLISEADLASLLQRFLKQTEKSLDHVKAKKEVVKQAKLNFGYLEGWWESRS